MTLAKLCEEYQVELCLFDGSNWHSLAPEQQIQKK